MFYFRGHERKLPTYCTHTTNLFNKVGSKVPALEVKYSGHAEPLDVLSVSKIAFWNAGRRTIDKPDMVKEHPIAIKPKEGCKIIDAEIIARSDEANKFDVTVARDRSRAVLAFDYLDKNDGAVILVFHTGQAGLDLSIEGKIKGATIRRIRYYHFSSQPQIRSWPTFYLLIVILVATPAIVSFIAGLLTYRNFIAVAGATDVVLNIDFSASELALLFGPGFVATFFGTIGALTLWRHWVQGLPSKLKCFGERF